MNLLFAAASGLLLVCSFPRPNLYYLAPVALVPLLVALARENRSGRRFLLGCVTGWIFWGGTCYWIYGVMHRYGNVPALGAGALFAGFFLAKGLHLGVFALLAGRVFGGWWAVPAVAAAWVAVEGTHPYAGFTWLMLGNAGTVMAVVARLAPWTGVAGMSFVLAMMNAGVALALLRRPRAHLAWLAILPLLYFLPRLPGPAGGSRVVQIIQPHIRLEDVYGDRWNRERAEKILRDFGSLSTPRGVKPELILWPENPAPFYYYNDPIYRSVVDLVAEATGAHLIISTVAFRDLHGREPLNSAVVIRPDGTEAARYDKIFLVPFGEFVPWPLQYLVDKVTREAGDFVPGSRVVAAEVDGRRVGTFICYESVFGRGVRRFVAEGAEVLVNLSNDGWFGRSAAREQHLWIARMRAMENARWLLRATNTGITAVIDPSGRVRATLPPDRPGVLVANFDYVTRTTLYTRWGDWFWRVSAALVVAAMYAARRKKSL